MTRGKETTTSAALGLIETKLREGRARPKDAPIWLALGQVRTCEEVFQHRRPNVHESAAHVRDLSSKVKGNSTQSLDPIVVWWGGKGWICLDGHHRLKAYRSAGLQRHFSIPVAVFDGSLSEALARAARANTRSQLRMSRTEKAATAWRLVTTTDLSKATQADSASVSPRLVGYMREVKKTLESRSVQNLMDLTWEKARQHAKGQEADANPWDEAAQDKLAQEWAVAIGKALGSRAGCSRKFLG